MNMADRVIRWSTALAAVGVAAVVSYELLMMVIRGAPGPQDDVPVTVPLGSAPQWFAAELAADRVPSIRAIRAVLHVGQLRAQRLREYLAIAAETHSENLAA